ncbi:MULTISPECIES: FUSC family membrane protein [unclassified Variovorax]|uniref:FUSC family protein n=1 Tax=unclassified Variovorax TaxID=663243 RepID=UPI0008398CFE|nr:MULTISPECIES: FUSC family membrane protein [unclassified Variovorax]PNG51960.1 Inner membrane protein YccS [Variovorax sp. B4]PNG54500.1 Inner membrane protein YccS [Variovorax sp. B2]VTV15464.1 Inner membrane protein YccS [Variovorax sp. WDL1]
MQAQRAATERGRAALRVALSHYVTNGLSVAFGLLLISGGVHLVLGSAAAAAAGVGVIVTAPPDLPGPRRGKFWQMVPSPLVGLPLFFCVQLLHSAPLRLGLLLVPATFLAFVAMAWGKRGIPIAIAIMFSMIFSMATPAPPGMPEIVERTMHFGLGAGLYVIYALLANHLLNGRYRVQAMADLLFSLAALMRTEARQFTPRDESGDVREVPVPLLGQLLRAQAALADQLQATRDIVLESPGTPRRQQLAGMLVTVLELRDMLLASELDLDALKARPGHAAALCEMQRILDELAGETVALADALLLGRQPDAVPDRRPKLAAIHLEGDAARPATAGPTPAMLARGLANRIGHINDEVLHLVSLARGDCEPDLAIVRANWHMFVSPTDWSLRPFLALWHWDAPPLRHAIRAALAVAVGYAIAVMLPWGSHDYWILLTIVVVLRGSLSQTLERRNSRVAGTLLGCVFAVAVLSAHPSALGSLIAMTAAQAIAHGFAVRRYLVTSVAATVLGLLQAHALNVGMSPTFALFERVADTLIGAGLAWAFCYVLPSWERSQIPSLVARTLTAQARHARLALGLGQLRAVQTSAELDWRLARREAYDSLSALVQATQRSLSEPRAVRPPLEPLEHLQAHSYQLLAQLSAVKSMLVLRRDRLTPAEIEGPLQRAAERIAANIGSTPTTGPVMPESAAATTVAEPIPLPDPFENDVSPWLLRRLDMAIGISAQLRDDAARILQTSTNERLKTA